MTTVESSESARANKKAAEESTKPISKRIKRSNPIRAMEYHHKSHNKTQETITPGAEAAHFQVDFEMLVICYVNFVFLFDCGHLVRYTTLSMVYKGHPQIATLPVL